MFVFCLCSDFIRFSALLTDIFIQSIRSDRIGFSSIGMEKYNNNKIIEQKYVLYIFSKDLVYFFSFLNSIHNSIFIINRCVLKANKGK